MIETLMKTYIATMHHPKGITSPMPHLFGPPGCGKSSMVHELAELVGKKMHTINVSRISPLELEGVQMPDMEERILHMLPATFWTQLEEGDILLLDEFLRGFPEVYNGMLDILTARRVGSFELPPVYIIGASNSVVAYDPALEDRLLHLPVPDPRNSKKEKSRIAERLITTLGLHPGMAKEMEMSDLLNREILPTYEILDQLNATGARNVGNNFKGKSIRNLIGQAQLREVQSEPLLDLIEANNRMALRDSKPQFVLLLTGKNVDPKYQAAAEKIKGNKRLTDTQRINLEMNLQLIEMEEARQETKGEGVDEDELFD